MTTFTTDDIRTMYNERAQDYQDKSWLLEGVLRGRKLRGQLFQRATGRVLDVACGTGVNFPHLARAEEIVGIELSPAMLKLAEQQAAEVSTPVQLHEMDATQLHFADASFDTVTSALSTCTFPEPVAVLREMARVCKPGGQILLFEHGRSRWGWFAWIQDRTAQGHYNNAGCRWNQDPQALVREAELRVVEAERHLAGVFHTLVVKH